MSTWLPITTAPRDGTRFLLWYAKEKRQYVVYFEEVYEQIGDGIGAAGWALIDTYFVVDSPANHTERYIIEEKKLADSYWQPLQTPPQL